MKKTVFLFLCFSQAVLAQHKKKNPPPVPPEKQFEYSLTKEELLNDELKGSQWYFDLKNYDQIQLSFDKNKAQPDVLYFVDAKNFRININQKHCKSLIKGTYEIMKKTEEPMIRPVGYHPFRITTPYQKCVDKFSFFLLRNLDISLDEKGQVMEMKTIEEVAPVHIISI
ncbi:hypothetical protein B0A69_20360 [Chryseobacterium shigense]|uniref:Uncharacterized protein n=1 Tax=Chryseobacterium shigense TaxID=297244 RepID=A0A1N7I0U4_9FLAO|nr:hypothetical protein [Chryseobacterium shigense]PQA90683.1 hypothetical protein B0A69_20360 [Chryseobacterium shigense]SIS30697.1 hypothetical protein SAMN05421639_101996 [Chryseobacterium shigense]